MKGKEKTGFPLENQETRGQRDMLSPEGMSSTYPHKAHSFSLNPSSCPAPGVGGALNHCHTQRNKFKLALGTRGCWRQRERSLQWLFQEVGCESRLGPGRLGETMKLGHWEQMWPAFCGTLLGDPGQVLSFLEFDFHMEMCIETNGVWAPV